MFSFQFENNTVKNGICVFCLPTNVAIKILTLSSIHSMKSLWARVCVPLCVYIFGGIWEAITMLCNVVYEEYVWTNWEVASSAANKMLVI